MRLLNLVSGNPVNQSLGAWAADAFRRTRLANGNVACSTFCYASGTTAAATYAKHFTVDILTNNNDVSAGYKIDSNCWPSKEEVETWLKTCHDVEDYFETPLREYKEKDILLYIGGQVDNLNNNSAAIKVNDRSVLFDGIVDIRDDQNLLILLETFNGTAWVDKIDSLGKGNIAAIGSDFVAGMQVSQDPDGLDVPIGTIYQWALDRSLSLYHDDNSNTWFEYFEQVLSNDVLSQLNPSCGDRFSGYADEWKNLMKPKKSQLFRYWNKKFPEFFQKNMDQSLKTVIPSSEREMYHNVELLDVLGAKNWEEIASLSVAPTTSAQKQAIQIVSKYLNQRFEGIPKIVLEQSSKYAVLRQINVQSRLPKYLQ